MEKKEDVRVIKSKRDLRNALLELLYTTPFDKITVTDICKTAMINKMTFYNHYQDKYSLLDDCVKTLAMEIYKKSIGDVDVNEAFAKDPVGFCVKLICAVLEECYEKRKVIESLVSGDNAFVGYILETCVQKIINNLLEVTIKDYQLEYPLPLISSFLVGGIKNVFEKNYIPSHPSVEEVREISTKFFTAIKQSDILVKGGIK